MTKERIIELLENYRDLSSSLLQRQAEIQSQINAIWERCHPKGLAYDGDRVVATPISYTAKLAGCADATDGFKDELESIEEQLNELAIIRKGIYSLDPKSQSILIKLYLNGYNISTLAQVENKDRETIRLQRAKAVEKLIKTLQ